MITEDPFQDPVEMVKVCKHRLDPKTMVCKYQDPQYLLLDVFCQYCGMAGAAVIMYIDISWFDISWSNARKDI